MYGIILTIDIIAAIAIVVLVLLQQGKGANMGVYFGVGASNTVFGSKGAASFLFKMTVFFTAVFFMCCLTLGYLGKSKATTANVSPASSDSSIVSQYDQYQKEVSQAATTDNSKLASK
ncbi:preprotein translocase subunit SecG [Francisella persica ATCC VR-331]|uniref:Protein-export membrane protein SecG n=1 Tax=Francisella persica ATCC VR-331 TaxID=1086726 RepID=A0AAC8ZN20_9GAMM|nr:preprotein translocase subunit SecG [Francisella persica]ALB02253.1 preprotein translocase subunit SecG [Francisella persica ATCC VR-331]ANH77521.1 preprotein translocase subunit SecG [Francisella persica ATCC VR-331]